MNGNRVFPYSMVYDPAVRALLLDNTKYPFDLLVGQVGIFNSATQKGLGSGTAWTAAPKIFFAQNVGDSRYGPIRTKDIDIKSVTRYYGQIASTLQVQISYYGYNGTDGDLVLYTGQELSMHLQIYDKSLTPWYGAQPYEVTLTVNVQDCAICDADCEKLDPEDIADQLVAQINGTDAPAGMFPTQRELKNFLVAETVTNGETGDAKKAGVKITSIAPSIPALNNCNPALISDVPFTTFVAGTRGDCNKPPFTTTQVAKPGKGYPYEVMNAELESQGYDRMRNIFGDGRYNVLNNLIVNAQSNKTYDNYNLEYNWGHDSGVNAASPNTIVEPYKVQLFVPRAAGTTLEAAMNSWISGSGVAAVDIDTTTTSTTTTTV